MLNKTVVHCLHDLVRVGNRGYLWTRYESHRSFRVDPNVAQNDRKTSLRDALDSLNHVCYVQDRNQACRDESGIPSYCLNTIKAGGVRILRTFQFICHHQQRDENLVRSLQCLHDTRVLAMLYFHIAYQCGGFVILDNVMSRDKTAYFYNLEINAFWESTHPPELYCLPKSVIFTCVRGIIEDHCGSTTADLVQNFILFNQDWYSKDMYSAGLKSNICDQDIGSDMISSSPLLPSGNTKLGISGLLDITAPGTALDTEYGKWLLSYLHNLPEKDLCTIENAAFFYQACFMSSDDKSEKGKFNILQFANRLSEFVYHGTQCSRLEQFTACWNLLQETCGPKVQGLEQHATLLLEGCKIQSKMDTVGCHWQDMLLPHYIQASRVTVWPTVSQCLYNPMCLDSGHYSTYNSIMNDLDTVVSLLQPGVDKISRKCGSATTILVGNITSKAPLSTTRYFEAHCFVRQNYCWILKGTEPVIVACVTTRDDT